MKNKSNKEKVLDIPHVSVLPKEVLESFSYINDGVFIDCTLGFGGHSEALLEQNPNMRLIGFDKDINAIEFSKKRLEKFKDRVKFYHGSFSKMIDKVKDQNIKGVLADIGVSSVQLDEKSRGFGFDSEKLDMRMNQSQELDAYYVINHYSQQELELVLRDFGEVSRWRDIASDIVQRRKQSPINTPRDLLELIGNKKERGRKVSVATLVFQAIRLEVNDELGELNRLLESLQNIKPKGARVGIITFHSLEDRIVKNTFKLWSKKCICPDNFYRCECTNDNNLGKIITKKPIVPTDKEIKENVRARSAKLRIFEFEK